MRNLWLCVAKKRSNTHPVGCDQSRFNGGWAFRFRSVTIRQGRYGSSPMSSRFSSIGDLRVLFSGELSPMVRHVDSIATLDLTPFFPCGIPAGMPTTKWCA
jgi:hypothetical protein